MNASIAACVGSTFLYWNGIIIAFGIAAGFLLMYSLYTAHSGPGSGLWIMLCTAMAIGVPAARLIHFYFNKEQYAGLVSALTDYSGGSFWLPAAVLALVPAAWVTHLLRFPYSAGELLDAAAPGAAFTIAMIRFSALFGNTCRSMIVVTSPALQTYPFADAVTDAAGKKVYHFASFFIMALLMLLVMLAALIFYFRHHADKMSRPCSRSGNVARLFLVFYCAVELVLDSTRADSSFLNFGILQFLNPYVSFVSLTQLFAAVAMLAVMIYYSRCSAAANGAKPLWFILLAIWILGLLGTGVSEYLVQRYTNRFMLFYLTQSLSVLLMAVSTVVMYITCRERADLQNQES